VKESGGWVDLGGGAHHPDCRQPLSVGDQERDRWEAGLHGEDSSRSGGEAISCLSLDVVPKGVQAIRGAHAGSEQIRAVE